MKKYRTGLLMSFLCDPFWWLLISIDHKLSGLSEWTTYDFLLVRYFSRNDSLCLQMWPKHIIHYQISWIFYFLMNVWCRTCFIWRQNLMEILSIIIKPGMEKCGSSQEMIAKIKEIVLCVNKNKEERKRGILLLRKNIRFPPLHQTFFRK